MEEETVVPCRNHPPNPKSLGTFSHGSASIQTQIVVRDSKQSVIMPKTTLPSGQTLSGERQLEVSDNALNHTTIRADPLSGERQQAVSGNALDHSAIRAGPSVARDSEQSVIMPKTNLPSGQALGGERQQVVSGNAFLNSCH